MGETVIKSGPMIKRSQNKKKWSLVNYKNRWFELSRSFIIYYDNCEGGREVSFILFYYFIILFHGERLASTPVHVVLNNLIFLIVSGVPFLHFTLALFFVYFFHSFHSLLTPISPYPLLLCFVLSPSVPS